MRTTSVTTSFFLSLICFVNVPGCGGDSGSDHSSSESSGGITTTGGSAGSATDSGGASTGGRNTGGNPGGGAPAGGTGGEPVGDTGGEPVGGTGGEPAGGGGGEPAGGGGGGEEPGVGGASGGAGVGGAGGAVRGGGAGEASVGGAGNEPGTGGAGGTDPVGGAGGDGGTSGAAGGSSSAAQGCLDSGGTINTAPCCKSSGDFPSSCATGACGCAPDSSHEVQVCACPSNRCFDGERCVLESASIYLLWTAPGGAAGMGPAMELLEDGTVRIWGFTVSLTAHETSSWDLQLTLTPEENRELATLLLDVDLTDLPRTTPWVECATNFYLEAPDDTDPSVLSYGPASALSPEFDAVYAWLESYFTANAPSYSGPGDYCEF